MDLGHILFSTHLNCKDFHTVVTQEDGNLYTVDLRLKWSEQPTQGGHTQVGDGTAGF